ncbi:MAG: hypothetical protein Fur006_63510 [Coleofasciculaceae cyanobacterium]
MLKELERLWYLSYQRSPHDNFKALQRKLTIKRHNQESNEDDNKTETNTVIPNLWNNPIYQEFIAYKLRFNNKSIVLLGEPSQIQALASALANKNIEVNSLDWDWEAEVNLNDFSQESQLIVCKIPLSDHHWRVIQHLKNKYIDRVIGVYELVLPLTLIPMAQSSLNYFLKSLEEIIPYYLGQSYFGPIDKLNEVFPLAGKTVIEFGPFDGCQTAGLVNSGVKKLICIEARAENAIKTMVARYVFGWNNVELVMDDFHNADRLKYGTYDLAFAHGVYYHSIAPFLFLENLMSLSNTIFLGGFCATENLPKGNYETLEYGGQTYRVKMYQEGQNFTAGVNTKGYFFHKEDLMRFFQERNYELMIISDEDSNVTAGNFLRFLACKK